MLYFQYISILLIFFMIAIQINNYKTANNEIEKIFLQYQYYNSKNNKIKFYYEYFLSIFIFLYILLFFKQISFFLLIFFFFNFFNLYFIKEIFNNIKLKATRQKIKKPVDIIDCVFKNRLDYFDIKEKKDNFDNYKKFFFYNEFILFFIASSEILINNFS